MKCPECGSTMVLRRSRYGMFYGCDKFPVCKATHGCHPDGRPLGTPTTTKGKKWRIRVHVAFDKLWKGTPQYHPIMNRRQAYVWMRKAMQLPKDEAHIGKFDVVQCKQLLVLLENKFPNLLLGEHEDGKEGNEESTKGYLNDRAGSSDNRCHSTRTQELYQLQD